jgi:hypothetical protein
MLENDLFGGGAGPTNLRFEVSVTNVRFGSLADITRWIGEVRFTLKSRHVPSRHQCLLSAKSGHCPNGSLAI